MLSKPVPGFRNLLATSSVTGIRIIHVPRKKTSFAFLCFIFACALLLTCAVVGAGFALYYEFRKGEYVMHTIARAREDLAEFPERGSYAIPDLEDFSSSGMEAAVEEMQASAWPILAGKEQIQNHSNMQGEPRPVYIALKKGSFDLAAISKVAGDRYLEETSRGWVLKIPLIIGPDASLAIAKPRAVLKLAAERGAFIGNFGKMRILGTTMLGWRIERDEPAMFDSSEEFRPYIVSWNGSKTLIAGNKISHLGFDEAKSYGLSFSSGPQTAAPDKNQLPRTAAWIIGNTFNDLYYGFYSYEASDILVRDNKFINSVAYGLDPHDRSERLLIIGNEITGTRRRHGLFLSQEVKHSWIINNHIHKNAGSGMVFEDGSGHNVIARNLIEANNGDGIAFNESSSNKTIQNKIFGNGKNGISIRGSAGITLRGDSILGNGDFGIAAYRPDIRNPRGEKSSFDVADALIKSNRDGHFDIEGISLGYFTNLRLYDSAALFKRGFGPEESIAYGLMTSPQTLALEKADKKLFAW